MEDVKEETQEGAEEGHLFLEGECFERGVKNLKCAVGDRKI